MSVRLISATLQYFRSAPELTTAERLLLLLIAERAHDQSCEAWAGRADDPNRWDLGELAGLSATGLRDALRRLAGRGLEVRVAQGKDRDGNLMYAYRSHQRMYRVPAVIADVRPSPLAKKGDVQASPFDAGRTKGAPRKGDGQALIADAQALIGDARTLIGDVQASPYPLSPSGPSRTVTGRRSRAARAAAPDSTAFRPGAARSARDAPKSSMEKIRGGRPPCAECSGLAVGVVEFNGESRPLCESDARGLYGRRYREHVIAWFDDDDSANVPNCTWHDDERAVGKYEWAGKHYYACKKCAKEYDSMTVVISYPE